MLVERQTLFLGEEVQYLLVNILIGWPMPRHQTLVIGTVQTRHQVSWVFCFGYHIGIAFECVA